MSLANLSIPLIDIVKYRQFTENISKKTNVPLITTRKSTKQGNEPVKLTITDQKTTEEKHHFNLRNKSRKNYVDDNNSTDENEKLPIYKAKLSPSPTSKQQLRDPYEFHDFVTKKTNPRRSSIIFDKFTYDIMKDIENEEVKKKRKPRKVRVNKKKNPEQHTDNNKVIDAPEKSSVSLTDKNTTRHHSLNENGNIEQFNTDHNGHENTLETSAPVPAHNLPLLLPEEQSITDCSSVLNSTTNVNSTSNNYCSNTSNPWRLDWITTTRPHFISVKVNALPRIDQEIVIDSSLVESMAKTKNNNNNKSVATTPAVDATKRKKWVQKNLCDYFQDESNTDENHISEIAERSLFDAEEFNSPIKQNRTILGDLTNRNVEKDLTYFGFDDENQPPAASQTNDDHQSNWRFNRASMKKYKRKTRNKNKIKNKENYHNNQLENKENESGEIDEVEMEDENNDISIMDDNSMDNGECLLFEEPVDTQDHTTTSDEITPPKRNEPNLDKTKRVKKHKTKFEIEQKKWIKQFQNTCEEIDKYQLEVE